MLGFIGGLIGLSFKILLTCFAVSVFVALIRNGKSTIRDLRDTLVMGIKVGTAKLQGWLFKKWKETEKAKEDDEVNVEATIK